ncbi:chymotrypsin-like protease CTRL-1 [Gigantopelta aegis]|uniref:chymotrypsin-like protease CTRL-1 n=1 Tax=Gigantopelta aegis TaxID=1735272 RepID=UPI001B889C3A|nr:chymotrypsin-like protease CTRL-1 [Gigantopelta aegis]
MGKCGKLNIFYYNNNGCVISTIQNNHLKPSGECGVRTAHSSRVVHGDAAPPGQWPWMLEIMYKGKYYGCGAVLLSPTWAVTAGHCVRTAKTYGPWTTIVRSGELDRHSLSGRERDYFVKNIIKHPRFDVDDFHDIALLELLTPVDTSSDYVMPVCLPTGHAIDEFVNKECWASGWGETRGTGDRMKLQQVQMTVSSVAQCHAAYGNNVTTNQVCASGGATKQVCNGDSGSPLSCRVNDRWYVVGVVSWGDNNCHGRPSVFTRISEFTSWIQSTTGIDVTSTALIG